MLVYGFATAVVMWVAGFLTHFPGVQMPPALVGILLLAIQLAGSTAAGRFAPRSSAIPIAIGAALITGFINLLILGLFIADPSEGAEANALKPNAAIIIAGYLAFSAIAGMIGGLIGSRLKPEAPDRGGPTSLWLARFGLLTVIAALPVLFSGGIVTSAGAGLAVPDWPASFEANMFLYPISRMTGGIYYEHAHRLFGSLVGLTTLTLMVFTILREPRPWVKAVAIGVFLLVVVQGILGGIRVTWTETSLAFIHGILGQLTFAVLCALAAFLSPRWTTSHSDPEHADPFLRIATATALALFILQLALGAASRHFNHHPAFLHSHITVAVFLLIAGAMAGMRAKARHADRRPLRPLGAALTHSLGLQFALGLAALWAVLHFKNAEEPPAIKILLATAHQAVGALLLALATLLFVWTRKLVPRTKTAANITVSTAD